MTDPKSEPSELLAAIKALYGAGIGGIQHVGRANYHEREREALGWVRDAMAKVDAAITPAPAQPEPTQEAADELWAKADEIRKGILAAQPEPPKLPPLTDDMLRYAMAAMGTGSPREADSFRLFWRFASEAYRTAKPEPLPAGVEPVACKYCEGSGDMFGGFACDECGGTGIAATPPTLTPAQCDAIRAEECERLAKIFDARNTPATGGFYEPHEPAAIIRAAAAGAKS